MGLAAHPMDALIDTLHDIGRCGCDKCYENPGLEVVTSNNNHKTLVSCKLPGDNKIVGSGLNLEEACNSVITQINKNGGKK